jgi:hypothetical protein
MPAQSEEDGVPLNRPLADDSQLCYAVELKFARREAGFLLHAATRLSGPRGRRTRPCRTQGERLMVPISNTLLLYCWVAIGGALGSVARYWCSGVAARLIGATFLWGTLFVNVTGSFIIGVFATLTGPDGRIFGEQRLANSS